MLTVNDYEIKLEIRRKKKVKPACERYPFQVNICRKCDFTDCLSHPVRRFP